MEEEIIDIVGEVKLTDSQKSVATSNFYSSDFTEWGSDKNNSSGKETYVIDVDDSDESEDTPIDRPINNINLNNISDKIDKVNNSNDAAVNKQTTTNVQRLSIVTQTSKTIIELAELDGTMKRIAEQSNLETQTSFMSISETKTVEYMVEISSQNHEYFSKEIVGEKHPPTNTDMTCNAILNNSLEDKSSVLESIPENFKALDIKSHSSSNDFITVIDDELDVGDVTSQHMILENKNNLREDSSVFDSEFEEDSLMKDENRKNNSENGNSSDSSEITKSVDNDVEELYSKLSNCLDFMPEKRTESELRRFGVLTPLTEESLVRKDSFMELAPLIERPADIKEEVDSYYFSNIMEKKSKVVPASDYEIKERDTFKLPPIQSNSHPSTPKSNFVLSKDGSSRLLQKAGTLSSLFDSHKDGGFDRWEVNSKNYASGEGNIDTMSCESPKFQRRPHEPLLPPILQDEHKFFCRTGSYPMSASSKYEASDSTPDPISITKRIRELKSSSSSKSRSTESKSPTQRTQSRSCSPRSTISHYNCSQGVAEKSCDALCVDLLKRLHSSSWVEISETLEDIPKQLEKFWCVISEGKIADLIRQVLVHVESPRTQLAKTACNAIACILKNTNYTKKPDFFEAMTILLIKTGSYSRPLRRAANMALDDIVSGVEHTQAVTALCIHGASHKSPLVRVSAARLLVVCAALAGAGRGLLRARPPTAAAARRLALRALAALLDDKSTPARKYAERFYQMLRPLPHFEAYFLSDADVETAARLMKKHDQLKPADAKER